MLPTILRAGEERGHLGDRMAGSAMGGLADQCIVLDARHVHPRLRRSIRTPSFRGGGYSVAGGCDEEGG